MVEGGANGDKGMLFSESYKGLIRNYIIKGQLIQTLYLIVSL
jgi:hypothetical protein